MTKKSKLKFGIFLSLLALSLAACARVPAPVVGERPLIQSADDLHRQLENRAAEIQSFRGRGNVSMISPQRSHSGNALLSGAKPALMRVDVLNFWGQPAISFLLQDQEIKFMIYSDNKIFRGPATPENLSRFLPVVVAAEDFLAILTGGIAFGLYEQPKLLESKDAAVYVLELQAKNGANQVKLTVEAQTLSILAAQWFDPSGQEILVAEFADFFSQGLINGPREINLASGDRQNQVRVRFRELTYNSPLTPEALALPVSGAVREVPFPR